MKVRDVIKRLEQDGWRLARTKGSLGAAGKTLDEVKDVIREAVEFHLEGMRAHGDPIPAPRS